MSRIRRSTLRSVLGKADLDALVSERERLNEDLRQFIDERTVPWGIKVTAVEIKDVGIPSTMQRAIARQAVAAREQHARSCTPGASTRPPPSFRRRPRS
jgi:regulator of protease activity HflC (stomatin/prohibitin superfamily)